MDASFQNFSDEALKIIQLAHQCANDLGHSVTGSEHILLGILSDQTSIPSVILKSMGITYKKTEEEVLRLQARSKISENNGNSFTPRAKALLNKTNEANLKTSSVKIEPEDIFIALITMPRCTAQKIIHALDIDSELILSRLTTRAKAKGSSDTTIDQLSELHRKIRSGSFESGDSEEFDDVDDPMLGYIIDKKYKVEEVIGRGGMGVVYKVNHVDLNRYFAIKILHPYLASDQNNMRRFQREAQAASRLVHPNLATVFDWDTLHDGRPYLVMSFIEGVKLSNLIGEQNAIPLSDWMSIFLQLCDALAHAHQEGVIHRDLKPGNIILANTGDLKQFVKIVDFGIAKLLYESADSKELTKTGEVFGSPLYMSPEQCLGQPIDVRSDIYSLGCVFYEILSGLPPFYCDSLYDTMKSHVSEQPKSLLPNKFFDNLPIELDYLVLHCLSKNADDRPQSMEKLRIKLDILNDHYFKS